MEYIANLCKEKDVALGISCSNTTTLDHHRTMVRIAKGLYTNVYIQVMGIAIIGIQGQPFDETVIARIVSLHKEFTDMLIQVDGSMNPKSTEKVLEAGATRVVVGSYIFDAPNVHNAYATILGDVMASLVELAVVHL
jgi:pentose-5-phosphate-3-epimerase